MHVTAVAERSRDRGKEGKDIYSFEALNGSLGPVVGWLSRKKPQAQASRTSGVSGTCSCTSTTPDDQRHSRSHKLMTCPRDVGAWADDGTD